jgi:hypothetical protein
VEPETTYYHEFRLFEDRGAWYAFECDSDGTLLEMGPEALVNYKMCVDGMHDVVYEGIRTGKAA